MEENGRKTERTRDILNFAQKSHICLILTEKAIQGESLMGRDFWGQNVRSGNVRSFWCRYGIAVLCGLNTVYSRFKACFGGGNDFILLTNKSRLKAILRAIKRGHKKVTKSTRCYNRVICFIYSFFHILCADIVCNCHPHNSCHSLLQSRSRENTLVNCRRCNKNCTRLKYVQKRCFLIPLLIH